MQGGVCPPGTTRASVAGGSVRPHLAVLYACGYWRGRGASTAAHSTYRHLTLALTCCYLLQECVYAYQKRGDLGRLARVMFLLLCHVTSLAKQFVFHWQADAVDRLVSQLDEPCFNRPDTGVALADKAAQWARVLLAGYSGCAVVTCTLWLVFPVMAQLRSQPVEFSFWTGVDVSHTLSFALVLCYSYYVTTLVGVANTTMDALMAAVLDQCKTQLIILRGDFEQLPEQASRVAGAAAGDRYEKELSSMFLDCLQHYNKITSTTALFQETFGAAILVQFGVGGGILCMAAYNIANLGVVGLELASMVLFTCCILTELFLYCYYGNEVAIESGRVAGSVYSMRWVGAPERLQRAVLMLLVGQARAPVLLAAGYVLPLSLNTFVKIIRSSYSLYAVLRQTK